MHGRKFHPNPKFLGTVKAYFVCHIGLIFQISLIYAFIGCPQSVSSTISEKIDHYIIYLLPLLIYLSWSGYLEKVSIKRTVLSFIFKFQKPRTTMSYNRDFRVLTVIYFFGSRVCPASDCMSTTYMQELINQYIFFSHLAEQSMILM